VDGGSDLEMEVLEERKVRNKSGRPEIRFHVQEDDGSTKWTDVDGLEPPRFEGKKKIRLPKELPIRQPGGSLEEQERPCSMFGPDVPSIFEDHEDGSRRAGSRQ
jgi:hypothetical protein